MARREERGTRRRYSFRRWPPCVLERDCGYPNKLPRLRQLTGVCNPVDAVVACLLTAPRRWRQRGLRGWRTGSSGGSGAETATALPTLRRTGQWVGVVAGALLFIVDRESYAATAGPMQHSSLFLTQQQRTRGGDGHCAQRRRQHDGQRADGQNVPPPRLLPARACGGWGQGLSVHCTPDVGRELPGAWHVDTSISTPGGGPTSIYPRRCAPL